MKRCILHLEKGGVETFNHRIELFVNDPEIIASCTNGDIQIACAYFLNAFHEVMNRAHGSSQQNKLQHHKQNEEADKVHQAIHKQFIQPFGNGACINVKVQGCVDGAISLLIGYISVVHVPKSSV